MVLDPSAYNDAGAPPVTVSIPVGVFNASGVNTFAASISSVPSLIGAKWLISMTCADGSISYISSGDSAFKMYDDTTGSAPPPANWKDPGFTDPGNLFRSHLINT
jgi:hypothetical protein